ncbi:hypothetical protein [Rhizobium sp.]|jgi:hypothetical protein|uniref:hypothetical protein n=1 Tax=Rhizobium sp. TaxID=391 RepID=UPI00289ADC93
MGSFIRLLKASGLIIVFSLMGFILIKLAFALVCWVIGHDMVEATIGLVASIGFGGWIGLEAFLSLRDWRSRVKAKDFDTPQ